MREHLGMAVIPKIDVFLNVQTTFDASPSFQNFALLKEKDDDQNIPSEREKNLQQFLFIGNDHPASPSDFFQNDIHFGDDSRPFFKEQVH